MRLHCKQESWSQVWKTQDKVTDIFIKPLKYDVFIKIKDLLGVIKKLSLGGDVESKLDFRF
jgi:hypothetical protein